MNKKKKDSLTERTNKKYSGIHFNKLLDIVNTTILRQRTQNYNQPKMEREEVEMENNNANRYTLHSWNDRGYRQGGNHVITFLKQIKNNEFQRKYVPLQSSKKSADFSNKKKSKISRYEIFIKNLRFCPGLWLFCWVSDLKFHLDIHAYQTWDKFNFYCSIVFCLYLSIKWYDQMIWMVECYIWKKKYPEWYSPRVGQQ